MEGLPLHTWIGVLVIGVMIVGGSAQLSMDYYANACPNLEQIAMATLSSIFLMDPTTSAPLLRLVFHDCQVQGCDASILLDSQGEMITSELISDKNFAIRKLNVIERIKTAVEGACPETKVSCADIIALAGRDAIRLAGGPSIAIPLGRRDSLSASNTLADKFLPPSDISVDSMLELFAGKGMTVEEAVSMLGAHTIGVGHCISVVGRLYPERDENLGLMYGNFLRMNCPSSNPTRMSNITFINNDMTTLRFDNQYFRELMNGRGLLAIDAAMGTHPRTAPVVLRFAKDQNDFFEVFSNAFVKLSTVGVLTGNEGQIRNNCHSVN